MKHKIYAIWDEVIEAYSSPILAVNKGHMLRLIEGWAKQQGHPLAQNPKDKTLFELGDWDDGRGRVEMYAANKNVGGLHEFQPEEKLKEMGMN